MEGTMAEPSPERLTIRISIVGSARSKDFEFQIPSHVTSVKCELPCGLVFSYALSNPPTPLITEPPGRLSRSGFKNAVERWLVEKGRPVDMPVAKAYEKF